MSDLRLVVFDVDGTLVDSQADIVASMSQAFGAEGLTPPARAQILGIVGLSLPQAIHALAPDQSDTSRGRIVAAYKDAYARLRRENGAASSPLYPGIAELLRRLHGRETVLLGLATGKSRRGLDALLETHGIGPLFVTAQCADDHPSKPHPAMLHSAMGDAGLGPEHCVMIGDTSFDIDMARAARMASIGVGWGYHSVDRLSAASSVVEDVTGLEGAIHDILEGAP
ncbi:HAD-IA family hydrolase [Cognatishimia sp. F0-27]|uniref:HAD-IA family hydrolase n=1 Tax=Cognatishimia sp. F0-27 TaxID=2816855 RepID=UPI001D0CCF57|nr:HAD-IA family hydrolase [Cognatishimia sp. F0-27]MCC1494143.1 HAD-IA family hydrolase [Cognatishimia sp. F0-27]